jgi:phytoene/squalene synthetase
MSNREIELGLELEKALSRIWALEAALREIADVRDGVPWNAVAIARAALAPEQDK